MHRAEAMAGTVARASRFSEAPAPRSPNSPPAYCRPHAGGIAPPVGYPIVGMRKPPVPESDPVFDEVLREGDVLLLPGGNWHHCENGPGRSVHVGIFLIPPAPWHAIKALTAGLLEEELYRTPLTRLDETTLLALETEIKQRLREKIGEMKFDRIFRDWPTRSH